MQNHDSRFCFLSPLLSGQPEAPNPEFSDRLIVAFADPAIRAVAGKIGNRLAELVRKGAFATMIEAAVAASDPETGNAAVLDYLDAIHSDLAAELQSLNAAFKLAEQRARERKAKITPLQVRAADLEVAKRNEIDILHRQIAAAREGQSAQAEKYRAAGLTTEQIKAIGALPSALDIEKAQWRIKVLEGEIIRLRNFQSDPLHRLANLQGLDLAAA